MDPENIFIYWAITEFSGNNHPFSEDTDFYTKILTPAEKYLLLKSLDYVAKNYSDFGHMLIRIDISLKIKN